MKLISHAIKNIKDNFKNYAVYFTLMCIISCVIYSFLALIGNEAVKLVVRDSGFLPTSFFLILVLGASTVALFFLVSSSISFIRARKREFLTDELTGAENAQTGNRSFLETFILGAVATIAGIAFGIFFSKLVTMFFLKMTTSSYSGDIYFSVEINAIIATIIVFLAVFYFVKLSRGRGHNKLNSEKMYKEIKESEEKNNRVIFYANNIASLNSFVVFKQERTQKNHKTVLVVEKCLTIKTRCYIVDHRSN